jgi:hypothetical protein
VPAVPPEYPAQFARQDLKDRQFLPLRGAKFVYGEAASPMEPCVFSLVPRGFTRGLRAARAMLLVAAGQ